MPISPTGIVITNPGSGRGLPVPTVIQPILPISQDSLVSIFPTEVKGVWEFNDTLSDEVGTNDFSTSPGSASYTQFSRYELIPNNIVTRRGLAFEEGKSYSASNSYSYPFDWTMAFWWNSPSLVGFTRHATTRELEPKVAPIIAIADPIASHSNTRTLFTNATFALTEIGYSKTQNAIRVYLSGNGTDVTHIITSSPYASGLRHVLITYIQQQGRFRIDIDGATGILHSAPNANLMTTGKFRINEVAPGFVAHKTTQVGGILFDLIFTTYAATDNESLKGFRYGYEHITHSDLFDTRFSYFGIAYSQPTTVSTTKIFVDGGNIFAARSNGKISKGARPIWDKEFSYPNVQSASLLNASQTDEERTIKWTTKGLELKGVSVRI